MGIRSGSSVRIVRNNTLGSVPIISAPIPASRTVSARPFGFSLVSKPLLNKVSPPEKYEYVHKNIQELVKRLENFTNLSVELEGKTMTFGTGLIVDCAELSEKGGMHEETSGVAFFAHRMLAETIEDYDWKQELFLGSSEWLGQEREIFYQILDSSSNDPSSRFVFHVGDGSEDFQIVALDQKLVIAPYGAATDIPAWNKSDLVYLLKLLGSVSREVEAIA